jgi:multiple sugar transport system permease protein
VFAGKLRNKFLRTIMLIPMIMVPVVVGLCFYYLYDGFFGIIPWLLRQIGILAGIAPLGDARIALWSIILVDIWQWTPFMVLILLAGVESLPVAPYEAAQVDNASRWQVFTKITLPLLRPIILIAVLLRVIDAFKVFDKIYVLTAGGPGSSTDVLCMWTYRMSFLRFNVSRGATVSLLMLYLVLNTCVFLSNILTREKKMIME